MNELSTASAENNNFASLGICEETCKALTRLEINIPTPIQMSAIPEAVSGKDIIGIAQTGTGKTYAFALPIIEKLIKNDENALIMLPTRELAWQVEEAIVKIINTARFKLTTVCLIGGVPIVRQIKRLRTNPRIIICTPGRLRDHLKRRTCNLSKFKTIVLDEADRMFDIGFAPQIREVLSQAPKERQTMLFSATMPPEIRALIEEQLVNPIKVEVSRAGSSVESIKQELCVVNQGDKNNILSKYLDAIKGQAIVFSRTKHVAKKLNRHLMDLGYHSTEIHSDRSMAQRRDAMDGFRKGRYQILVATDIAARGIDVSDVDLVVNYDLPQAAEDYVHRIGRTGRAGKDGHAISFALPDQTREIRQIERLTTVKFNLSELSLPLPVHNSGGGRNSNNRGYSQSRGPKRNFRRRDDRRY